MTPTKDDALAALAQLGDSSTLPDIERNSLETVIRAALTQPRETVSTTMDKWEPLKISNGYQYPAQSGEYIVRMIDGAELRSQYDGRFFRRKDNWDKIIPDHEIVCFKAIRAQLEKSKGGV